MDVATPESESSLPGEDYPEVDPFLIQALQNPRHRLTVLRMEFDIKRFMRNSEQTQFEFQHFPTSYLRLAAHRVAQHYRLQSMVLDVDGSGGKILVKKTPDSKLPNVFLSQIPANIPENDGTEHVKIATRPRSHNSSPSDTGESSVNKSSIRSVEERKEEYDKARARIFSNGDLENLCPRPASSCSSADEHDARITTDDLEKFITDRDGNSRVAIFRDREKDRCDPDYDRSYHRYSKGSVCSHPFVVEPLFNMQGFQPAFIYENELLQLGQIPGVQNSVNYMASNPNINHFGQTHMNGASCDSVYMQWSTAALMYAESCEHFRQSVFQAPSYQHPLSIDHGFHHWSRHW